MLISYCARFANQVAHVLASFGLSTRMLLHCVDFYNLFSGLFINYDITLKTKCQILAVHMYVLCKGISTIRCPNIQFIHMHTKDVKKFDSKNYNIDDGSKIKFQCRKTKKIDVSH